MKFQLNVVLFHTLYSSNIGSSARALANMGGGQLILIDPQCEINSKARQGAAGAQDQLNQRITYKSLKEFQDQSKHGPVIGLSARVGKQRPSQHLKHCLTTIQSTMDNHNQDTLPIYFLFGREDCGLSTEDLEVAHYIAHLPTYGEFKSYNLSQAVLLSLYIFQDVFDAPMTTDILPTNSHSPGNLSFPTETLRQWLELIGFDLSAPRKNALSTLQRIIISKYPTPDEINTLSAIVQQTIRKLKP